MKYVIHSTIIFDTTEYTLQSLNDYNNHHTSVKLSNSAGKILEELIKYRNTNVPVTREHLFSIVWRAHGLIPSNGNLNQQISLIRKNLISFGLHASSIITIPKRGLKLNNQLKIKQIEDKKLISHDNIQYIKQRDINSSSSMLINFKSYIKYIMTLTIMLIIALSMGLMYFYTKTNNIKLYCCKEMNTCDICGFHSTTDIDYNDYSTQISEIT